MKGTSKFSFSKLFYNDKFVMFFSVVVAFCIWVALPGNSEETTYASIKDIPISVPELGNDLKVFYMDTAKASVRVSGNSLILRNLTKDDIEVTFAEDFTSIESAVEKKVKLTAKKGSLANDYSIQANSLDPEEVTVFVDREDEKDLPLKFESNASVPDSYHLDSVTMSQKSVNIKGAQSIINEVSFAKAVYYFPNELTDTQTVEAQIKFYDSSGDEINTSYFDRGYIEASFTTVNVKVPVLKVKKLQVEPEFINYPENFSLNSGIFKVSPETVEIAVPDDETMDIDKIATKPIDLSKVNPDKAEYTIELVIPSGVRLIDSQTEVKVTFLTDQMDSRNFTVKPVKILNTPTGKTVTVYTKSVSVTLVGDKQQLAEMDASDLSAFVDMSDYTSGGGSVTKNAQITIDSYFNACWPYWLQESDPYPVVVSVSDKTVLATSSSTEPSS